MPSLQERVATVEIKVDNVDERVDGFNEALLRIDGKIDRIDSKISSIQASVAENKVNTGWTRKLVIIVITAIVSVQIGLIVKDFVFRPAVAQTNGVINGKDK